MTQINLAAYNPDSLLVRLDSLRARLLLETDQTMKTFIVLQIDDVIAEAKRRNEAQISAIASASLS